MIIGDYRFVQLRVLVGLWEIVKRAAHDQNISVREFVERALQHELDRIQDR